MAQTGKEGLMECILNWILDLYGIEMIKPMIINPNDQFQLIEIASTEIFMHPPCTLTEIRDLILKLYGDQPLKYFNENKRLKVIHLKTATVKDATLDISSY